MTILEKIKIWCKLKPQRQVRIYSLLERLAKALKNAGFPQEAEDVKNSLYGSTSGEILDTSVCITPNSPLRKTPVSAQARNTND